MFIFDSKTDILIDSQELTFKSEYFCDFSRYFQNREFVNGDALQLSGDHFEGYLSRIIIDEVMLELSQRNCLINVVGVVHSKMWVFAIPIQVNSVFFQNLYSVENNYLGIVPPKSEISIFQHPFSNRFQLYVHDNYLTIVPKFRATRSEKVFKFFRFFCCDLPIGKNSSSPTILSSTLSNAI